MVSTYVSAVQRQQDVKKGLTTTNQGGEAYQIDVWTQLRRFLILGSEGGTFYISERELTKRNIEAVSKALDADGIRTVNEIVAISKAGRAPKNDPALLALAMASSYRIDEPSNKEATLIRNYAIQNLPQVARIPTHLFHYLTYVQEMRGWGAGLRKGVGKWYTDRSPLALAQAVTKYQSRDGWSNADALRLSHPTPPNGVYDAIFKYVVDGELPYAVSPGELYVGDDGGAFDYLNAVEQIKRAEHKQEVIGLIETFNLPREVIPTQWLKEADVWESLLYAGNGMPMTAMIRNLATMTRVGVLSLGSDGSRFVQDRLGDMEAIRKARVHPIDVLKAKLTYEAGQGVKSDTTWTPVQPIVSSLEGAFYNAFGNVEPTGKVGMLALDVSGSMTVGESRGFYGYASAPMAGVLGLSPRMAAAAICLITARTERNYMTMGFTHGLVDLRINERDSLESAMQKASRSNWGGTDCRLPFQYAIDNNLKLDYVAVYTDNETGYSNPSETMRKYRQKSGKHDAKLIVNGMTANNFSIADPSDPNMLDIVGFDTASPQLMSEFVRGL